MKKLRVLYLAQYADLDDYNLCDNNASKNYAFYHIAFRKSIRKLFDCITSTHDINYLIEHHSDFDYVISLYNRFPIRNSEVFISSLCEYYSLPYLGATPNIRAVAEDKHIAKSVAATLNIQTPQWIVVSELSKIPQVPPFNGPYFVKPRFGASSKLIDESSICDDWKIAKAKIAELINLKCDVIVEKFIDGLFYSVPTFYNKKPIISEPYTLTSNKRGNTVTFLQKRASESGLTRSYCGHSDLTDKIMGYSEMLYKNVMPLDYARFDYIVEKETEDIYFLEFNVCCNLSPYSGYVETCIHNKLVDDYDDLLKKIIYSSLERQKLV